MTQSTPWDPGACVLRPHHPAHFHCRLGTACEALGNIVRHPEGGWGWDHEGCQPGWMGKAMEGSQQTSRGGQGLPRVTIKRTWGGWSQHLPSLRFCGQSPGTWVGWAELPTALYRGPLPQPLSHSAREWGWES